MNKQSWVMHVLGVKEYIKEKREKGIKTLDRVDPCSILILCMNLNILLNRIEAHQVIESSFGIFYTLPL